MMIDDVIIPVNRQNSIDKFVSNIVKIEHDVIYDARLYPDNPEEYAETMMPHFEKMLKGALETMYKAGLIDGRNYGCE